MPQVDSYDMDLKAQQTSQAYRDLALKQEVKNEEKRKKAKERLERVRDRILKEREIHESNPTYLMTRARDGVAHNEHMLEVMSQTFEKNKKQIEEEYERELEKIKKKRDTALEYLHTQYQGENGKLVNGERRLAEARRKLEIEEQKKPKNLIHAEYDYKKLLEEYAAEFKDRPDHFFKFLKQEEKEVKQEKAEESEEESDVVYVDGVPFTRMELALQVARREMEDRLREQQKQQEQSSYSSNTVYGYATELPKPKVIEPPPAPPVTQEPKKKKSSVTARALQEKASGVHTYALPK